MPWRSLGSTLSEGSGRGSFLEGSAHQGPVEISDHTGWRSLPAPWSRSGCHPCLQFRRRDEL